MKYKTMESIFALLWVISWMGAIWIDCVRWKLVFTGLIFFIFAWVYSELKKGG